MGSTPGRKSIVKDLMHRDGRSAAVRLLALLALISAASCTSDPIRDGAPPAALTVQKNRFTLRIPARGAIESQGVTPVATPEVNVPGLTITRILPEGATVRKGDIIVEFDPSEVRNDLEGAEREFSVLLKKIEEAKSKQRASMEDLAIELKKVRLSLEQAETRLRQCNPTICSRNDVLEAEMDRDLAEAHRKEVEGKLETVRASGVANTEMLQIEERKLKTRIEDARKNLDSMQITAPSDGVLVYREGYDLDAGEVLESGWPYFEIHQPDRLRVKAYVLEQDAGVVKTGQDAEVVIDAFPDKTYKGSVEWVDSMARTPARVRIRTSGFARRSYWSETTVVKYFEVQISLQETDLQRMRPGMPVKATITAADIPGVLTVPLYSVFEENGKPFVFLVGSKEPERRPVTLGARSRARAVVTEGLAPGDRVALRNPFVSAAPSAAGEETPGKGPERPEKP
jgi:HlyD family secretion protein